MLVMTPKGLYCRAGNFYIDPNSAVDRAVITHAHSDHARRGSRRYHCASSGVSLLKSRLGKHVSVEGVGYRETFKLGNVEISFHPAGHILGSAQVRLEHAGEVWVVSGDYKRDPDPTCEPFEVVTCDVFVTEATFGTPAYRWPKGSDLGKQIFEWWCSNAERGVNSVLFAYSLGKAQRVLGALLPYAKKTVYCHPAVMELNECYRSQGIKLAPATCVSRIDIRQRLKGELVLVPQGFLKTEQARILGDRYETAFASGWMAKETPKETPKETSGGMRGYDRGFIMSDHADWDDLVMTVQETGAKRVYVQHRGKGALVRHLKTLGIHAFPDTELQQKDADQLTLF